MKFAKALTRILVASSFLWGALGILALIAAYLFIAMWSMLVLASWGVPGVLAFLLPFLGVPVVCGLLAGGLSIWLDRYSVQDRVKAWIRECTATPFETGLTPEGDAELTRMNDFTMDEIGRKLEEMEAPDMLVKN